MRLHGKNISLLRAAAFVRLAALALVAFAAGATEIAAQGRRLGFVVGFADYGETKHPTALQDAGLVAQGLKQAGFDLTEAANLSQNEFRTAFRDFAEKAAAAGPDSIIAVYIAGVGFQEDGENILLPVGARLRHRSDLSLEGLRVGDFLRSLSGIPSAGRIVMLDAAYTHPYGELVADSGRGFAPVEKRDGLLVAYNQSPDQVSPLPRTNYSHFALALAEALREPGVDLNAVFERIRLRVHDLSQGAETPWNVNGITRPIILVAPVVGAAATTQTPEMVAVRRKPVAELSGDEAYARAVEVDTIPVYEEFIRAHPRHAQNKRIRAMIAARREAYYWQRARRSNTDRAYWTYLRRYPRGAHAGEAEGRLTRLSAPLEPPPQFEEVLYDDLPPPPPEEIEIYETIVAEDGWESLPPPTGYAVHLLPPPPLEIIELAPPPPNPSSRLLPTVVIGAGVIGAAILANRVWNRPATVRPVVAPPIVRPPRPPFVGPGGVRPGTGGPAPLPPGVRPQPPVGVIQPPVIGQPPVGVRPPGTPGIPGVAVPTPVPGQPVVNVPGGVRPPGTGGPVQLPPGARPPGTPPVGVVAPTPVPGQPVVNVPGGVRPPVSPPVGVAPTPPTGGPAQLPRPGAIQPRPGVTQPGAVPPAVAPPPVVTAPVAPPVATPSVVRPPVGQTPPAAAPPALRPQAPPPGTRPPAVQRNPNIGPRPPTPPSPPGSGPPPRQVRQIAPPPQVRQAPPPGYMPVPQRQPLPQVRQRPPVPQQAAPPPQVRQAPPPQVRPVAPLPQVRQAPPPQVRAAPPPPPQARPAPAPAARPAPAPCTPQMKAARQC